MTRHIRSAARFALGLGMTALTTTLALPAAAGAPTTEKPPPGPLLATLEANRPFAYAGDQILVRLTLFNTGDKEFDNSAGINLLGGLGVFSPERGQLKPSATAGADEKGQQPAVVAPGGFFGVIKDVVPLVSGMDKPDTYSITWQGLGVSSNSLFIRVIPKFDPTAHYVATFETDFGNMEFDLLTQVAPVHVRNFYDLALQGFYDNIAIHQIIKGVEVRGGDLEGTGYGRPIYLIPSEVTKDLKHVRGTLSSVFMPAQKQDHGSQFIIALSTVADYDGTLSIFGQMRTGEEVLKAIESIPTTGQHSAPYFKPLKPLFLKRINVTRAVETKSGS